jgi:hypothetical protein
MDESAESSNCAAPSADARQKWVKKTIFMAHIWKESCSQMYVVQDPLRKRGQTMHNSWVLDREFYGSTLRSALVLVVLY